MTRIIADIYGFLISLAIFLILALSVLFGPEIAQQMGISTGESPTPYIIVGAVAITVIAVVFGPLCVINDIRSQLVNLNKTMDKVNSQLNSYSRE